MRMLQETPKTELLPPGGFQRGNQPITEAVVYDRLDGGGDLFGPWGPGKSCFGDPK